MKNADLRREKNHISAYDINGKMFAHINESKKGGYLITWKRGSVKGMKSWAQDMIQVSDIMQECLDGFEEKCELVQKMHPFK